MAACQGEAIPLFVLRINVLCIHSIHVNRPGSLPVVLGEACPLCLQVWAPMNANQRAALRWKHWMDSAESEELLPPARPTSRPHLKVEHHLLAKGIVRLDLQASMIMSTRTCSVRTSTCHSTLTTPSDPVYLDIAAAVLLSTIYGSACDGHRNLPVARFLSVREQYLFIDHKGCGRQQLPQSADQALAVLRRHVDQHALCDDKRHQVWPESCLLQGSFQVRHLPQVSGQQRVLLRQHVTPRCRENESW